MATVPQTTRRVLYTTDGRHSGCVLEDGMLKRKASAQRHQLRRPPAWAFEEQILREAERNGVTLVQVLDTDTGCTFTSSISRFWTHGLRIERGYGVQWALPLNQWYKQDPKQRTLF
jgi:hypothetical protein